MLRFLRGRVIGEDRGPDEQSECFPGISADLSLISGDPSPPPLPPTRPKWARADLGEPVEIWRICAEYGRFLDGGKSRCFMEVAFSGLVGYVAIGSTGF